jgi:hypothetical protein
MPAGLLFLAGQALHPSMLRYPSSQSRDRRRAADMHLRRSGLDLRGWRWRLAGNLANGGEYD